jgi:hypothetical protein
MQRCNLNRGTIITEDEEGKLIGCPCLDKPESGTHRYDGHVFCAVAVEHGGICPRLADGKLAEACV